MDYLINLVKQFLLQPKEAWERVKDEPTTVQQHLLRYVAPLALIPAFAMFVGYGIIGRGSFFGVRLHAFEWGISQAVTSFVSTILGVYISGFVIHKLAPSFQTQVSLDKAVLLVGYSYTALLIGGIFNIYLPLALFGFLAALYSLYTLFLGFKPMTGVSEEKSTGYFIVSILVIIMVYILLGLLLASVIGALGFGYARSFM